MSSILEELNILSRIQFAAFLVLSWSLLARAQIDSSDFNQYKRAAWGAEQGISAGRVQALAQTRDGYLWIGTAGGLFRFDGVRFVPILTEQNKPLLQILGLTVDQDGILWVRAADTRLRQVHRDRISAPVSLGSQLLGIVSVAAGRSKGIYATDLHKSVFRIIQDHVEPLPIHSRSLLISVSEANDGRLWIGTDRGLLSWTSGAAKVEEHPEIHGKINCLLPDQSDKLWVGTDDGLAYWDGHQLTQRPFQNPEMQHLQVLAIMEDQNKGLWVGTSRGLIKYSAEGAHWAATGTQFDRTPVTAIMQDREGDIWFGAGPTLERLEGTPIIPVRLSDPTSGATFGPLYIDPHGRIWFADSHHGLFWIEQGVSHAVLSDGLATDEVYSIDGDGDAVWVGRRNGGLTRLTITNGIVDAKTWTTRNGLSQNSVYVVRVSSSGTIWAGTLTKGLNEFVNGRFIHIDETDGLPASDVSAIELGVRGQVWVGTSGGVCKMQDGHCFQIVKGEPKLGKDVLSLLEDPSRGLWIGTTKGLALADDKGQRIVSLGTESQQKILGLGLDVAGRLWIASDQSVISALPSDLLASKATSIRAYGYDDGLQSDDGVHRSRSLVTDKKGQVWIATAHELAMASNARAALPSVIPHVEEVSADGVFLDPDKAKVPPGAKRISFSFTGLDLHAPTRVRFRYRLDDFDKTWSNTGFDRGATYTNLAPGTYTFRLIASNESGVWSAEESTLRVVIEPNIWQRWWVRIVLAVSLLLLSVLVYQARMNSLLTQANILADERLRERTRIARDVHDTLLQGFISSLMHLHVADQQIANDSPLKQRFTFVLEGMERVIEEARLAVVGLRSPDSGHLDIESSLRDFFQEIADFGNAHIAFQSTGRRRPLKTDAMEQICSIAKEAVLNAVRHANAQNVQVAVNWGWFHLRVSVTDDGCGIDAHTLVHGRAHHWGLLGMRERAKQLKASLKIVSRSEHGTKVSLNVPALMAYRGLKEPPNAPHVG